MTLPNPSDPLALLLAAVVAMGPVIVYLFREHVRRTDQFITHLQTQITVGHQREDAWRDEARAGSALLDRQLDTLAGAVDELRRRRAG